MTPVLKLFTAKEAVALISEGIESFGGLGYMENSRIPVILRDAQVLPIREGTTNILSLDFVNDIFKNFKENIEILKGLVTVANFNPAISTSRLDSIATQEKVNVLKLHSDKFLLSLQNLA